jgi:hypothetical protein
MPDLTNQKAKPETIRIEERRSQALELRKRGLSYRRIRDAMRLVDGVSPRYGESSARDDVFAELTRLRDKNLERAEQLRTLEATRLDALLDAVWEQALSGNLKAVQGVLKISARRARLEGLDMPIKTEISGPDGSPIKIAPERTATQLYNDLIKFGHTPETARATMLGSGFDAADIPDGK